MRGLKQKGARVLAHRLVGGELRDDEGRYRRFMVQRNGWTAQQGDAILGDVVLSEPDETVERDRLLRFDGTEVNGLVTLGTCPASCRSICQAFGSSLRATRFTKAPADDAIRRPGPMAQMDTPARTAEALHPVHDRSRPWKTL